MATCLPEVNKSGFHKNKKLFEIAKIGKLPSQISESSGLARVNGKNSIWTHNDSGGKSELYEIDSLGHLLSIMKIPNIKNTDWEDLAQDYSGNLYIGDFGNNSNRRKDLTIYKIKQNNPGESEKITFNFADQKEFPPTKKERNFDCEAFFWTKDSLFLFSKNRGDRKTKLYVLPAKSGNYSLFPKSNIYLKANITSADISPDGKQFALLSYGKLFLFGVGKNSLDFTLPQFCIKASLKQSEAIVYISTNKLVITNEQGDILQLILKPQ